jgi:NAD-dependent deacetylase
MIDKRIIEKISYCLAHNKMITFLAGAGISADSGIPTFRGKDGFWVSGSKNYQAQEIGTYDMFRREPEEVWKWFLYRKSITENAKPNQSHFMLKEIGDLLGKRFALISQNIDSLHKKAGSNPKNTYLIHGDLDYVRCGRECSKELYPFPAGINLKNRNKDVITADEWRHFICPKCGAILRPHVLWFDERYNEEHYKWDTVVEIARQTGLLFILGTSGATSLPQLVCRMVLYNEQLVVDVNIENTDFSDLIGGEPNGIVERKSSSEFLTDLKNEILKLKTKGL